MHIPSVSGDNLIYAIRLSSDLDFEYRYVGLTSSGRGRMFAHVSNSRNPNNLEYSSPKYRWMRKHQLNITFDVLEYVPNRDLLPLTEMKWIHILKERGHRLLNLTDGGEGIWGHRHSETTRAAISKAATGRVLSVETRRKMSESRKGKVPTEETRKKLSASNSGSSNAMFGTKHSMERRSSISKSLLGRPYSATTRIKMSESMKGNTNAKGHIDTEETRANKSASKMGDKNPNFGKKVPPEVTAKRLKTLALNRHNKQHIATGIRNRACTLCTLDLDISVV